MLSVTCGPWTHLDLLVITGAGFLPQQSEEIETECHHGRRARDSQARATVTAHTERTLLRISSRPQARIVSPVV